MIELLRIRVLINTARLLLFVGRLSDRVTNTCNGAAKKLAIEVGDWFAARDAARRRPLQR